MIELRWITKERERQFSTYPGIGSLMMGVEPYKVLQYRFKIRQERGPSSILVWSEWVDVPEEEL